MLNKNTVKFIKTLRQKKFRQEENSFFVEGAKNVTEVLRSDFKVSHLLYTDKFATGHQELIQACEGEKYQVNAKTLESLGLFKTNEYALAVAEIKENKPFLVNKAEMAIVLDDINDPGNLGTIIRIADWYGINKIIMSPQTADFYNPKVLNSSMGSFTRVSFFYTELEDYLSDCKVPIYGAFLKGENIHHLELKPEGIVLMGSESHGVSEKLWPLVSRKLTIPSFGGAESLNVAIATAVICDNLRRAGG